jgi:hypothetical protein
MADTPDTLQWLREIDPRAVSLRPPADPAAIREAEAALRCAFPEDYRQFLSVSDGAMFRMARSRFKFLPVTRAGHVSKPNEINLVDYHRIRPADEPFLAVCVVYSPDEHLGFMMSDLAERKASCPLYLEWHESGEYDRWADSLAGFLACVARAGLEGTLDCSEPAGPI